MSGSSIQTGGADILYGRQPRKEQPDARSRFADQLSEELHYLDRAERSVLKVLNTSHQTNVSLAAFGIAQILYGDSVRTGDQKHLDVTHALCRLATHDWVERLPRGDYKGYEDHLWGLTAEGVDAARRLLG